MNLKASCFSILFFICISLTSCSTEETVAAEEDENQEVIVTDTYKLIAVSAEGKIFEVGNNTGTITTVGQIENSYSLLIPSTLCKIGTKIYAIEASYEPAPNILRIYDTVTGQTTLQQLTLPASITNGMLDPFITTLKYNGTDLIAIVNENMPNSSYPNRLIAINPLTYQITDLDINFFQRGPTSTELIGGSFYIATWNDGLVKINLSDKSVTEIMNNGNQISGTRLTKINATNIALMKSGGISLINGVRPTEILLNTATVIDKSLGNIYAVGTIFGNSIFYNEEYVNIVFNTESKFGLLKVNYQTNETNFVELNYSLLGSNVIIVDIKE